MLKLRPNQMLQIQDRRVQRFGQRVVALLREHYASHLDALPDGTVKDLVEHCTTLAPHWGFRSESDIAEVTMLLLEIRVATRTTAEPPWFRSIVDDPSLNPNAKLYHLVQHWQHELGRLQGTRTTAVAEP